jgi:WD40 repeat protein
MSEGKELRLNTNKSYNHEIEDVTTVLCFSFWPHGMLLATGSNDYSAWLCNVSMGGICHYFEGHFGPLNSVVFSSDGQFFASSLARSIVELWSLNTRAACGTLPGHLRVARCLTYSPDGKIG